MSFPAIMLNTNQNLPKSAFFGRSQVLDWLQRVVFTQNKINCSPLILLHGIEGIGKTATCECFLVRNHNNINEASPFVSMQWRGPPQNHSVIRFSEMLLQTAKSNVSAINGRKSILYLGISSESLEGALKEVEDTPREIYDSDGTARSDLGQQVFLNQQQEQDVAKRFGDRLLAWVGANSGLSPMEAPKRIVFVFDGFDTFQAPIKRWIGGYLYPELERLDHLPECAYILTGRNSWEGGGQADYWKAHPGALRQYLLTPLVRHECEEWLVASGQRPELLDVLVEETEGVPRRIEAALRDSQYLEAKSKLKDKDTALGKFSAKERRWLHAGAMSENISLEALQVLLGRLEGGIAFDWLAGHGDLCTTIPASDGSGSLVTLRATVRDLVLSQAQAKIPLCHQDFLEKMELLSNFSKWVPSSRHRGYLGKLSPVQPISEALINDVFGDDG